VTVRHRQENAGTAQPTRGLWPFLENVPPPLVAALALLIGVLLIIGSVLSHTNKAVRARLCLLHFYKLTLAIVGVIIALGVKEFFRVLKAG
jgi:hypothetical protein